MTIAAIIQQTQATVITASPEDSVAAVAALLAEKRIGALPVVSQGRVVGIFSERDLIYGLARNGPAILDSKVADAMTSPAITVEQHVAVLSALSLMTKRRIRHLPVVENDMLIGLVSIGDLVKHRIDRIETEANAMRDYIQMA